MKKLRINFIKPSARQAMFSHSISMMLGWELTMPVNQE